MNESSADSIHNLRKHQHLSLNDSPDVFDSHLSQCVSMPFGCYCMVQSPTVGYWSAEHHDLQQKNRNVAGTSLHRDLCSGDVVRPCCCSQMVALLVFPLDWLFSFLCDTFIARYLAPCGFCLVLAVVSCTVSLPLGEVHHCHCGFVLTSKNNELNSTNLIFSPINRKKDESEFKGSISDSFSLLCI